MIEQVHPGDFSLWRTKMQGHGSVVVLDVREDDELALASLPAQDFAVKHIPMGALPQRLQELNPAQPIACLCHHGNRSQHAATFLQSKGFKHLANIAGGINAWSMQVDPSIPRY